MAIQKDGPFRVFKDERSGTRIFVGDASDVMDHLADKPKREAQKFKLVFADPPFNIGRKGYDKARVRDNIPVTAYEEFTYRWLTSAMRLMLPYAHLVVNCYDNIDAEIKVFLKRQGLTLRRHIIWHYRFGQNQAANFIQSKQHVLWFTRGNPVMHMDRVLEPSDRASKYGDSRTQNKKTGTAGMRSPFDVWQGEGFVRVQGNNKERWKSTQYPNGHDNQLPERYLRRVVAVATDERDHVFDAFVGSGGLATVASSMGRICWGSDLSPKTAASALARVRKGPVTPSNWR